MTINAKNLSFMPHLEFDSSNLETKALRLVQDFESFPERSD